jgi:hypothetical protein
MLMEGFLLDKSPGVPCLQTPTLARNGRSSDARRRVYARPKLRAGWELRPLTVATQRGRQEVLPHFVTNRVSTP